MAKRYRKKLSCRIIAIVGSYGKTTTKDMLYSLLKQKYNVQKTHENQNNEIGVPLTLLNTDSRTDILLLELGMRQKGDLKFLTQIVRPTDVVFTGVGLSHMQFFKTPKDIAKAKSEVFQLPLLYELKRQVFINQRSDFFEFVKSKAEKKGYTLFPFSGQTGPDRMLNMCYLIGQQFGLSESEIQMGLKQYEASAHRLNKLQVKDILLVDDTYNANPEGVKYALEYISPMKGRKILVLGDMLELGSCERSGHQSLIETIIDAEVSLVFAYGEAVKSMKSDLIPIHHFQDKKILHDVLLAELKSNDIVLVKGSRGMKMEETVRAIQENYVGL
ncbi:hypothetical protein DID77_01370 [Candidatus Marinamargulisbacteria bacterium SCGC AG-439-L15]|nr:hypothetical protein DID77_01370 [Candidatus Marinamargulisbacteria bacterium SCGC AG-439-L15]